MAFDWGYKRDNGPTCWCDHYSAATGRRQSPIDIDPFSAQFDNTLGDLKMNLRKSSFTRQMIKHMGHNFQLDVEGNATLSGGPLAPGDVYRMAQFHFHWGEGGWDGSEHQLKGRIFPAELHIVFWNSTRFKSFAEAAPRDGGLAVLGIFIEIGTRNEAMTPLINALTNIKCKGHHEELTDLVDVDALLPEHPEDYFTYPGSLTTPPCFESVTWIVMKNRITITDEQLSKLRQIHNRGCCGSEGNYRLVQPLNDRVVRASFAH